MELCILFNFYNSRILFWLWRYKHIYIYLAQDIVTSNVVKFPRMPSYTRPKNSTEFGFRKDQWKKKYYVDTTII